MRQLVLLAVAISGSTAVAWQDPAQEKSGAELRARVRSAGVEFLKSSQAADGSFSPQLGPGVTALCALALMRSGVDPTDAQVARAIEYVKSFVQADGGVYNGPQYQNYETSIAVMCLHAANRDGSLDGLVAGGSKFLRAIQWDADESIESSDARYGGQGYGNNQRPDVSNTGMFIDALQQLGTDTNDPAIQEALVFISRSQNLPSPYNTTPFADRIQDGGFYYTPAGEGDSKAGRTENGGLKSYASMTYVGFKSLLYAGVDRDDPRVQAARQWIADHYTFEENPGVGQQGLYYYYHVAAKCLAANGEDPFPDGEEKPRPWRRELTAALAARQRPDGSWVNAADRWYEGDPNLVTAYALLALSYCE